jgi:hypothetical protein
VNNLPFHLRSRPPFCCCPGIYVAYPLACREIHTVLPDDSKTFAWHSMRHQRNPHRVFFCFLLFPSATRNLYTLPPSFFVAVNDGGGPARRPRASSLANKNKLRSQCLRAIVVGDIYNHTNLNPGPECGNRESESYLFSCQRRYNPYSNVKRKLAQCNSARRGRALKGIIKSR